MNALYFLKLASSTNGRIVCSGDLTEIQLAEARKLDLFFVDEETGLGWAILPWNLTTSKDRSREISFVSAKLKVYSTPD